MNKPRQDEIALVLVDSPFDGTPTSAAKVIDEAYVLIPRAILPVVREGFDGSISTDGIAPQDRPYDPLAYQREALRWFALAEWVRKKEDSEAAELQARRDAVAKELWGEAYSYSALVEPNRKAIDRIIDLEDGTK